MIAGDLANCVRILERDAVAGESDRVAELVWASVTEEVLGVRARLEGWTAPQARSSGLRITAAIEAPRPEGTSG